MFNIQGAFLILGILNVQGLSLDGLDKCVTVPEICPNVNITFWLYTREIQNKPHQLDLTRPQTISEAPFVSDQPFKILIHGYTGWKDYSPNTEIRPALLAYNNFNVISIDYGPIVKEPCYINAVKNVRVAANCTAQMIDYLVNNSGINLKRFHVIGFSLGAQVSGLIAEFLKSGKLDHITGLDPAFPLFWGHDGEGKLDKTDAKFVDVIHTNALVKGKLIPCGHVDFYCNGGKNQPGCDKPEVEDANSCNHARAPAYYAESINSTVGFWGKRVWYKEGSDEKMEELMGFHTPPSAQGAYFLKTNAAPPFARGNVSDDSDESGFRLNFDLSF